MGVSFDSRLRDYAASSQNLIFEQLPNSAAKAALIAGLYKETGKDILVITGEGIEETKLRDDLLFFQQTDLLQFPSHETLESKEALGIRSKTLQKLVEEGRPRQIVIASLQSTLQYLPSIAAIETSILSLKAGGAFSFPKLIDWLQNAGYQKEALTSSRGEYSVRGGIIDLFPVTEEFPARIEFFGDEIESIRLFDPSTQKSFEEVRSVDISSSEERVSEKKESLFSLIGKKNSIVILDDIEKIEDRYSAFSGYNALVSKSVSGAMDAAKPGPRSMSLQVWLQEVQSMSCWCMLSERPLEELAPNIARSGRRGSLTDPEEVSFSFCAVAWSGTRLHTPFAALPQFYMEECLYDAPRSGEALLDGYAQTAGSTHTTFVIQSESERGWLRVKLSERGCSLDEATVREGYLSSGFCRRDSRELFLPMSELSGRVKIHRIGEAARLAAPRTSTHVATGFDAYDIEPGDSVVHFHHGIGTFIGIEKKTNIDGADQEFFLVEYAEGSKLFVPLHQAHLITKYIGANDEKPRLHILGAARWKRLREETEKAIVGYASDLLRAQACRQIAGGVAIGPDSEMMQLFEAEFPYQETEDQMRAIDDVKGDMCSSKAMDRLICGDVGYGKTEVAMRAAFKAVIDGKKQVVVLVPTTVLAMQHYENFVSRMKSFPVKIGLMSRFQPARQARLLAEQAASGEVDILIGTHKLLQKGLVFKDLGLVVIDEEQRFGVKAKEHLKILKSGVDCLTLSATPIPRTLYMSLVGAKALSTISTPPYDRLPIKSHVLEYDPDIIHAAILRELNRGGQIFYIYNRVETIGQACEKLQQLVPRARITAVHGQMDGDEIDLIFHAFKKGEIDVLVATSIIENGIDISNANTIIIERADRFGVAELYQLRGRVGRSNKHAFAYFLVPARALLSEIARKRLAAISHAGGYGGGLKVAMRDLEIRGAGDMLGTHQSGHVASIGFHLYCKLLKRTVDSMQGKSVRSTYDTKIDAPFLAKIPEGYIRDIGLRIEIYQRCGDADSVEEIDAIVSELTDRFGPEPVEVRWLVAVSKLRVLAALKGIVLIKLEKHTVTIERKQGKELSAHQLLVPKIATPEAFFTTLAAIIRSL